MIESLLFNFLLIKPRSFRKLILSCSNSKFCHFFEMLLSFKRHILYLNVIVYKKKHSFSFLLHESILFKAKILFKVKIDGIYF